MNQSKINKELGKLYAVDLIACNPERIKFKEEVRDLFLHAVKECGASYIDDIFYQFEPYGVTGIVLIAESHFSLHTWPEEGYVSFDIFTCGTAMKADTAIEILQSGFEADDKKVMILSRGY